MFSEPSLQADEADQRENSYSVYQPGTSEIRGLSSGADRQGDSGHL